MDRLQNKLVKEQKLAQYSQNRFPDVRGEKGTKGGKEEKKEKKKKRKEKKDLSCFGGPFSNRNITSICIIILKSHGISWNFQNGAEGEGEGEGGKEGEKEEKKNLSPPISSPKTSFTEYSGTPLSFTSMKPIESLKKKEKESIRIFKKKRKKKKKRGGNPTHHKPQ